MPEQVEENGMGGKSELEILQFKSNQVTDESLESTRRMMALCDESKEAGIRTLVALDDQGEQLDRIEEDMDKINADMKEAEKNLEGMEKCCGICVCPCNKSSDFKEDASTWKASEDGKIVNNQPARVMDDRNGAGPMGGYIAKITNDAREEEMEDNMQQVSTMIGNLRNMAIDMGSEMESQNRQLDRINLKNIWRPDMRGTPGNISQNQSIQFGRIQQDKGYCGQSASNKTSQRLVEKWGKTRSHI